MSKCCLTLKREPQAQQVALAGAAWHTAAAVAASEEVPQGQHAAGEVLCENRPPSRPASKAEEKRPASAAAPGQEQAPAVEAEEAAPLALLAVAAATGCSESTIDVDLLAEPQELAPAAEPSHSDSGEW